MPPPPSAELVNPTTRRGPFRAAVFDFDGTVSLVREGWAKIMAGMGMELIRGVAADPDAVLMEHLEDQMLRLSGKPSIFQMRKLAEEVAARGGAVQDADALLQEFLRRLFAVSGRRCDDLATGRVGPDAWAVPGTHALLDDLRRRGVALYLASGTDLSFVKREAELLQLTGYFGEHVYAPADNTPDFTKRDVIEMVLKTHGIDGGGLLGFGDGYAETVEVKRAGGTMVGVASNEPGLPGVNALKRAMLADLGADVIVPDYRDHAGLLAWLFEDN